MKRLIAGAMALAAMAFVGSVTLFAADLGGNCCADLEERIAELEATVAKKGNRKVTVEIYGQVSKSLLWIDGGIKDAIIGDNPNSPSRFGFVGKAKITPNVEAGYVIEIGADDALKVRHNYLYLSGPLGKVSLGLTSAATDQISELSTANTNVANLPTTLYGSLIDGDRRNLVRYDTPSLAGAVASVSWSGDGIWDAALRIAGDTGGIKSLFGIGYSEDLVVGRRISGSASFMETTSGLFLNGAAGRTLDVGSTVWHLTGGVERKLLEVGKTTGFVEYGKLEIFSQTGDGWGVGLVQAIDAAAMDMFISYRSIEDVSVVHLGSRIKF